MLLFEEPYENQSGDQSDSAFSIELVVVSRGVQFVGETDLVDGPGVPVGQLLIEGLGQYLDRETTNQVLFILDASCLVQILVGGIPGDALAQIVGITPWVGVAFQRFPLFCHIQVDGNQRKTIIGIVILGDKQHQSPSFPFVGQKTERLFRQPDTGIVHGIMPHLIDQQVERLAPPQTGYLTDVGCLVFEMDLFDLLGKILRKEGFQKRRNSCLSYLLSKFMVSTN